VQVHYGEVARQLASEAGCHASQFDGTRGYIFENHVEQRIPPSAFMSQGYRFSKVDS
jgi:hypothetical protein